MYPPSFFWYLGGMAIIIGILGLVFILAMSLDNWLKRHDKKDEDDGNLFLRVVFEVLSAFFVIAALITTFYSDNSILRLIAAISLMVIVTSVTVLLMQRIGNDDDMQ